MSVQTNETKLDRMNRELERLESELEEAGERVDDDFDSLKTVLNEIDFVSAIMACQAIESGETQYYPGLWEFWIDRLKGEGINVYFNSDWELHFTPANEPDSINEDLEEAPLPGAGEPGVTWFRAVPDLLPPDRLAVDLFYRTMGSGFLPHIDSPRLIGGLAGMIDLDRLANLRDRLIAQLESVMNAYKESQAQRLIIYNRLRRVRARRDRRMIRILDDMSLPEVWKYWIERTEAAGISVYYHKVSRKFHFIKGDPPREIVEAHMRQAHRVPSFQEAETSFYRAKSHIIPSDRVIRILHKSIPGALDRLAHFEMNREAQS